MSARLSSWGPLKRAPLLFCQERPAQYAKVRRMSEVQKPKRGRPALPTEERGRSVRVYMAPDVEAWLKAQPEGMSKAIAKLVRGQKKLKTER